MTGLIMAGQLMLALMILVGLHEFGHMITAKWFGMRVEKFSIGFPPKLFGKKWGETEYSFGMIPLGGFVKITGMVDESMDTENLHKEPEPHEFRAKPAWQRLIVMLGGIIMNVITGMFIFTGMLWLIGTSYIPAETVQKNGIVAHELAQEIGLQTGDKIMEINGQSYDRFAQLFDADVLLGDNSYYTVQRGDSTFKLALPSNLIEKFSTAKKEGEAFISPFMPYTIKRVIPGKPAAAAGLEAGDKILTINQKAATEFNELRRLLQENKGKEVSIKAESKTGELKEMTATVQDNGTLGFEADMDLETMKETLGLGESFLRGTGKAFGVVFVQLKAFGKMFSGDLNPASSLSGPIGIAQQFGGEWQWDRFWAMTGLLSMVLAFMNLLPIPALDGGHVMFLTYEMISGRKPGDKFMENAQKFGMGFLLLLMVFVIGKELLEVVMGLF